MTQAVRPGLMLYGVSPFTGPGPVLDRSAEALDLEPVMTLAARVVATRRVAKGEAVGYGATWRATRATTVATLPLGYADGIPRAASPGGGVVGEGAVIGLVGSYLSNRLALIPTIIDRTPASATKFSITVTGRKPPLTR